MTTQRATSFFVSLFLFCSAHIANAEPNSPTHRGLANQRQLNLGISAKSLHIEPLTQTRYIVGGVVGSALGFGIGHSIVGEYNSMGWVFTMSQVLSLSIPILAALTMAIIYWEGSAAGTVDHLITTWGTFLWIGVALWAAFRVWEIVDLWVRPHHRLSASSNHPSTNQPVVIPSSPKASFAILPTILPQGGVGLGLVGQW